MFEFNLQLVLLTRINNKCSGSTVLDAKAGTTMIHKYFLLFIYYKNIFIMFCMLEVGY